MMDVLFVRLSVESEELCDGDRWRVSASSSTYCWGDDDGF